MSQSKIKYLKLPQHYEVDKLQRDLNTAQSFHWKGHFNDRVYDGDWKILGLITPGGESKQIFANIKRAEKPESTDVLDRCPYFRELLNDFPFEISTARLMRLAPGAYIKPHTDHCLGYSDGDFRLHLPITTNPALEFILGGERVIMPEGTLWYINANYEHSVANRGETERVHLVVDGKRNRQTDELFFSLAPQQDFFPPTSEISASEKALMIERLREMGTPTADAIIEQLQSS